MSGQIEEVELRELMFYALDGTISDDQFVRLEKLLADDPAAVDSYVEFMVTYASLCHLQEGRAGAVTPVHTRQRDTDQILLEVIEEDEKMRAERAAEEERREAELKREAARKAAEEAFRKFQEQERRRQEKLAYKRYQARQRGMLIGIGVLAASLLLVVLTWIFMPYFQSTLTIAPPLVATIAQTRNAQWKDPEFTSGEGTRLAAAEMELKRGIAQIAFDDGAEVILQAPCRFKLENSNQMLLEFGNLAAAVPKQAIGFTVRTRGATVVDYGTGFGVAAHADGRTETHVFEGQVDLRSGSDTRVYQQSQRLNSGEANTIDAGGNISRNKFRANYNRFLREMPDKDLLARPGQLLDLSDVVSGGNGFGSGRHGYALDPKTGEQVRGITPALRTNPDEAYYLGNSQYHLVEASPFVDGVFVPDGSAGPVKVSSAGHTFKQCPDTTGAYYVEIFNSARINNLVYEGYQYNFIINKKSYKTPAKPAISMHSNLGITFDLDQIRAANPGCRIVKFHALLGISEDVLEIVASQADFWVLVDGQVRFSRKGASALDGGEYVDIELNDRDRFLSLITTEGDETQDDSIAISHDWCVIAVPTLELALTPETSKSL